MSTHGSSLINSVSGRGGTSSDAGCTVSATCVGVPYEWGAFSGNFPEDGRLRNVEAVAVDGKVVVVVDTRSVIHVVNILGVAVIPSVRRLAAEDLGKEGETSNTAASISLDGENLVAPYLQRILELRQWRPELVCLCEETVLRVNEDQLREGVPRPR